MYGWNPDENKPHHSVGISKHSKSPAEAWAMCVLYYEGTLSYKPIFADPCMADPYVGKIWFYANIQLSPGTLGMVLGSQVHYKTKIQIQRCTGADHLLATFLSLPKASFIK